MVIVWSAQALQMVFIWLIGGLCALCVTVGVLRLYCRVLLERQASRAVDSLLFRLQLRDLCAHAAKNACCVARAQAKEGKALTKEQVREMAQGRACDHVRSYGYTHLPISQAEHWYAEMFRVVYFMSEEEVALLLLPLQKGRRYGVLARKARERAQV